MSVLDDTAALLAQHPDPDSLPTRCGCGAWQNSGGAPADPHEYLQHLAVILLDAGLLPPRPLLHDAGDVGQVEVDGAVLLDVAGQAWQCIEDADGCGEWWASGDDWALRAAGLVAHRAPLRLLYLPGPR